MYTVYILNSKHLNKFYIGYTSDLDTRLLFHENSSTFKFTGKAKDWEVYFKIEYESKKQALAIEKYIKKMKSTKYIRNLTAYPEISERLLASIPESQSCYLK